MGKLKPASELAGKHGKLYGEQLARVQNTPKPLDKIVPKCPKELPKDAKAAWEYCAAILENWGLFNAANAPHLEMFAANWAWYLHHRKMAYKHERGKDKLKRNPYLGPMNTFEKKAQMNLAAMGVGTMGLAKVGQAMARATKKEGIEALMD